MGTFTMLTSKLKDNNATEGANLYLDSGSKTTYVLPVGAKWPASVAVHSSALVRLSESE